jgi:hypothetical protein
MNTNRHESERAGRMLSDLSIAHCFVSRARRGKSLERACLHPYYNDERSRISYKDFGRHSLFFPVEEKNEWGQANEGEAVSFVCPHSLVNYPVQGARVVAAVPRWVYSYFRTTVPQSLCRPRKLLESPERGCPQPQRSARSSAVGLTQAVFPFACAAGRETRAPLQLRLRRAGSIRG